MSVRAAYLTVWLLALARVVGGAALLWLLGAPTWAIAAWLLLHLRFKIGISKPTGAS